MALGAGVSYDTQNEHSERGADSRDPQSAEKPEDAESLSGRHEKASRKTSPVSIFRKIERNLDIATELAGKQIYFALYAEDEMSEAKLMVNPSLSKMINCGEPLEKMLASFRQAILNSARAHGNKTVPRA